MYEKFDFKVVIRESVTLVKCQLLQIPFFRRSFIALIMRFQVFRQIFVAFLFLPKFLKINSQLRFSYLLQIRKYHNFVHFCAIVRIVSYQRLSFNFLAMDRKLKFEKSILRKMNEKKCVIDVA